MTPAEPVPCDGNRTPQLRRRTDELGGASLDFRMNATELRAAIERRMTLLALLEELDAERLEIAVLAVEAREDHTRIATPLMCAVLAGALEFELRVLGATLEKA